MKLTVGCSFSAVQLFRSLASSKMRRDDQGSDPLPAKINFNNYAACANNGRENYQSLNLIWQ